MCTGGACDGRHPIRSEGIGRHWENRAAFEGQEGSQEEGFLAKKGGTPAQAGV